LLSLSDLDIDLQYLIANFHDEEVLVVFLNKQSTFPEYDEQIIEELLVAWLLANGWVEVKE
jgi:hypothetical protein